MTESTKKDVHSEKSQSQIQDKATKLSDSDLDKVAGGIGGLGAPIPVRRP